MVSVKVEQYQRLQNHDCCVITMKNARGAEVSVLNYGATLERFAVPLADGTLANMILSLNTAADYSKARNFLGGTVGRIIGRMQDGFWDAGDKKYQFELNDGPNHAHGGSHGFDTQVFDFMVRQNADSAAVILTLLDPAGHDGYPGNVKLQATYTFDEQSTLTYHLSAITDAKTLMNPANHTYFNLDGGGQVLGQKLMLDASAYLPLNANSIPDAGRAPVAGTPFDFRAGRQIRIALQSRDAQIVAQHGLNHPFLLDGHDVSATLTSSDGARRMTMKTTAPAIVVYTGNHFDHTGVASNIGQYDGVALEAQFPPSADPTLQAITLLPGEHFEAETSWHMDF